MKEFRCGAIVPGCETKFEGESEQEILDQVWTHARDEHGMPEVPGEIVDRIRSSITERPSASGPA
jgi:predicted small metal-binding protein